MHSQKYFGKYVSTTPLQQQSGHTKMFILILSRLVLGHISPSYLAVVITPFKVIQGH